MRVLTWTSFVKQDLVHMRYVLCGKVINDKVVIVRHNHIIKNGIMVGAEIRANVRGMLVLRERHTRFSRSAKALCGWQIHGCAAYRLTEPLARVFTFPHKTLKIPIKPVKVRVMPTWLEETCSERRIAVYDEQSGNWIVCPNWPKERSYRLHESDVAPQDQAYFKGHNQDRVHVVISHIILTRSSPKQNVVQFALQYPLLHEALAP